MFYNQPLSIRFGTELLKHVDYVKGIEPYWDTLDVAVAWVRASGVSYLQKSFTTFLKNGGHLSFIVGIDLYNTTRDGLQALLDLEGHGVCETVVYHNESGSVFHPKIYLFRNEEEARLIVGSNNLTAAGLFSNVEAGLQVDTTLTDGVIADAADALASWRDETDKLAAKLNADFLAALYEQGYVVDEAAVRESDRKKHASRSSRTGEKLFGSRAFTPPKRAPRPKAPDMPAPEPDAAPVTPESDPAPEGTTVLMRLRKARETQTQIPFRVAEAFFRGMTSVESAHTGQPRGLQPAKAHGNRNTIKLEIPELRELGDVFARFEKTPTGIIYEVYDGGTPRGNQIKTRLEDGMRDGSTQTSIKDVRRATWWRYI